MEERHNKVMETVRSLLGEQFEDFLIIVKPGPSNLIIHYSDKTWAVGAVKRLNDIEANNEHIYEDKEDK